MGGARALPGVGGDGGEGVLHGAALEHLGAHGCQALDDVQVVPQALGLGGSKGGGGWGVGCRGREKAVPHPPCLGSNSKGRPAWRGPARPGSSGTRAHHAPCQASCPGSMRAPRRAGACLRAHNAAGRQRAVHGLKEGLQVGQGMEAGG